MGYFNRQGDEPGVRTPVTTGEPPTTTDQSCIIRHTAVGDVLVEYDAEYCPGADVNVESKQCNITNVEFDFRITSECICWPPADSGSYSLNGWFDNAGSESFVVEQGSCTTGEVFYSGLRLVTYDILGRLCDSSCNGKKVTTYINSVPYLDLLSEVDSNTGQNLGFPWKAGPFQLAGDTVLTDNEPFGTPPNYNDRGDGLIDGADCPCLHPHTITYETSPGQTEFYTQCASSPAVIDCLLSYPCPNEYDPDLERRRKGVLFGLFWNHINKLDKPNPCPQVI